MDNFERIEIIKDGKVIETITEFPAEEVKPIQEHRTTKVIIGYDTSGIVKEIVIESSALPLVEEPTTVIQEEDPFLEQLEETKESLLDEDFKVMKEAWDKGNCPYCGSRLLTADDTKQCVRGCSLDEWR